jgi:hypothetical protein
LTSITIPASVTSIGLRAFSDCNSLTTVFYGGANNAAWSVITGIQSYFDNTPLTDATRYYYSATNPGTPNTHWRYVNEIPTVWGAVAQQLAAPLNLQAIGISLTWSAVNNASGYTVDIDGTEYTATTNSFSLSVLTTAGTYTIKVKAKGNGATYADSDWSQTVQYTVVVAVVTFNPNGGNWNGSTANKTVTAVNIIPKPDDPVKGGYNTCFDGWYKEAGLINAWDFENDIVTTAITLYAKWIPYAIGDTGPGGGTIFYRSEAGFTMTDNNSTAYYLERAPYSIYPDVAWASSGFTNTNIAGTETGIGTGRKNTALILATDTNAPAALACRNYGISYHSQYTEKTDWFLPSYSEMEQIWRYMVNSGTFSTSVIVYLYWTSSQAPGTNANQNAQVHALNELGSSGIGPKTTARPCWAIRAF